MDQKTVDLHYLKHWCLKEPAYVKVNVTQVWFNFLFILYIFNSFTKDLHYLKHWCLKEPAYVKVNVIQVWFNFLFILYMFNSFTQEWMNNKHIITPFISDFCYFKVNILVSWILK